MGSSRAEIGGAFSPSTSGKALFTYVSIHTGATFNEHDIHYDTLRHSDMTA